MLHSGKTASVASESKRPSRRCHQCAPACSASLQCSATNHPGPWLQLHSALVGLRQAISWTTQSLYSVPPASSGPLCDMDRVPTSSARPLLHLVFGTGSGSRARSECHCCKAHTQETPPSTEYSVQQMNIRGKTGERGSHLFTRSQNNVLHGVVRDGKAKRKTNGGQRQSKPGAPPFRQTRN